MTNFLSIIRGNQDIIAMLVLGAVFERHPDLHVVCVEADAGWAPHFMYRMDHAFKRHRTWLTAKVDRLPSEYFREHVYMTFQDDFVAFQNVDQMNWRRLCWANDFPHSDSTWPWSQDVLDEQTIAPDRRAAAGHPVRQRRRAVRHRHVRAAGRRRRAGGVGTDPGLTDPRSSGSGGRPSRTERGKTPQAGRPRVRIS